MLNDLKISINLVSKVESVFVFSLALLCDITNIYCDATEPTEAKVCLAEVFVRFGTLF